MSDRNLNAERAPRHLRPVLFAVCDYANTVEKWATIHEGLGLDASLLRAEVQVLDWLMGLCLLPGPLTLHVLETLGTWRDSSEPLPSAATPPAGRAGACERSQTA